MLNDLPEWKALEAHRKALDTLHMRELFTQDPVRFRRFSLKYEGLMLDYSKNRITDETIHLLCALARACDLESWRDRMFSGDKINNTEDRAVLHTALRRPANDSVSVDGENVIPFVHKVLDQMKAFSESVHEGRFTGHSGRKINTVVNIGIGGSDLGPRMVCEALHNFKKENVSARFVSNIDGADIHKVLADIDPETTLFIIASKTFTTQETMTNAGTAKAWILNHYKTEDAIASHFIALSTNREAVEAFGIAPENIFPFRDWVGGRYSLWSSIGLSICLALGFENFRALLDGAYVMDEHFREAPLECNIPVLMGLVGLWYRNFWDAGSIAILPYSQDLASFPAYLQQLDMESNGKRVGREGAALPYETGPALFGEPGTNGQHSFYQLLHQGTDMIPCDFIGLAEAPCKELSNHHDILQANMLAQSQALMQGQTLEEANDNPQKVFPGNRPSNTIVLDRLDPFHLGMLVALYEHKVFVQGIIWNINSFDQWGVELGKILAKNILGLIQGQSTTRDLDSSTVGLANHLKSSKESSA